MGLSWSNVQGWPEGYVIVGGGEVKQIFTMSTQLYQLWPFFTNSGHFFYQLWPFYWPSHFLTNSGHFFTNWDHFWQLQIIFNQLRPFLPTQTIFDQLRPFSPSGWLFFWPSHAILDHLRIITGLGSPLLPASVDVQWSFISSVAGTAITHKVAGIRLKSSLFV